MRVPDWRAKLQVFIAASLDRPFAFGTHDCALFAADAMREMTGLDLGEKYRGRYKTLAEGVRLMRKDGFDDHVDYFRAHLPSVPVAFAMPGDLAAFDGDEGKALGVVQGAMVYVLRPDGVVGLMPVTDAVEAFTV